MVQYLNNGSSGFQQFMASKDASKKSNFGSILVWIGIAILAGWLISHWFMPSKTTVNSQQPTEPIMTQTEDMSHIPVQELRHSKLNAKVQGMRISQIQLNDYKETGGDKSVSVLSGENEFAEIGILANGTAAPTINSKWERGTDLVKSWDSNIAPLQWKNSDGVVFARVINIDENNPYVINIQYIIKNPTARDFSITPYARIVRDAGASSFGMAAGAATGGIAMAGGDIEREDWKSIGKKSYAFTTPTGFVGFEDQYWQTIAHLDTGDQTIKLKPLTDGRLQAETSAAAISVPAGQSVTLVSNIFAGPKTPEVLSAAAAAIPGIEQTIDYGWFWFLARPFLWTINYIHGFVGNYGVAIILFTILLRILMWPLTKKSFTGMAAMQKMQPEMQRIQKMYANDKMRMQQEMLLMYKKQGASPMSGCLPMILQIPIFFALYKALIISVPMRQAGFLWMNDLAVMDPYFILPILMGATMWWQQHLQSAASKTIEADPNNPMAQTQKMMKWLPLIFTAMFAWMPAGLVLYWTVSNLFGIGQMWWIKKR